MSDEESKKEEDFSEEPEIEDEEDEEEDDNNYVQDDFINDELDDSEHNDSPKPKAAKKRKRKRSHHSQEELDEDDLDLVKESKTQKGRKRLRKAKEKELADHTLLKDENYADEDNFNHPSAFIDQASLPHPSQTISTSLPQLQLFTTIFGHSSDSEEDEPMPAHSPLASMTDDQLQIESEEKHRNDVLKTDIPERLYLRLKSRLEVSDSEMDAESLWIYKNRKHWQSYQSPSEKVIASVRGVIKYFRKDKFDIPFLATYRCYMFQQELQPSDYWEIYEMDVEWNNFLKTKNAIEERLEKSRKFIAGPEVIDECFAMASNSEDLEDIHGYLTFLAKI